MPRPPRFADRVREATRQDNAGLCALFAEVSMRSDLHLTVERDPNFFALYDLQTECDTLPWVLDHAGRIEAIGTCMARPGWLGGTQQRVGYLGDLRFSPRVRGKNLLNAVFGDRLRQAADRLGADLFYTALITSNRRAIAALTSRPDHDPSLPRYTPFHAFNIRNIQFTTRKRRRSTALDIRTATPQDLPAVAQLLAQDHQHRSFGYVFTERLLQDRLRAWPHLNLDQLYLAWDRRAPGPARLVGTAWAWDAEAVKRYRVLGYYRRMRTIRLAFNAAAHLLRFPPLPKVGALMRSFYLTHLSVPATDPAPLAALLDTIYADHRARGYHFFSVYAPPNGPLQPAFRPFRYTDLPATLFAVTPPHRPAPNPALLQGRPGFEMALV